MKTNENQRLLMKTNERKEKSDHLEFILMMLALLLLCEAIFLAAEIILNTMSNEMPATRWRSQRS